MLQQFNRLKQEIESARTREMRRFLGELIDLLDRNGISLSDLIEYRAATGHRVRPAIPPKYMDPATGRTWTGRGREPQWIRGKDRSVFLIDRDDERAP
ncbi:H-NS histone family protein [Burkholderia paludis]|nr:H-NS histone family protein [Burkholderia paludis]